MNFHIYMIYLIDFKMKFYMCYDLFMYFTSLMYKVQMHELFYSLNLIRMILSKVAKSDFKYKEKL